MTVYEALANLAALQIPRLEGGKGRRPPRACKIELRPIVRAITRGALIERHPNGGDLTRQVMDEVLYPGEGGIALRRRAVIVIARTGLTGGERQACRSGKQDLLHMFVSHAPNLTAK